MASAGQADEERLVFGRDRPFQAFEALHVIVLRKLSDLHAQTVVIELRK